MFIPDDCDIQLNLPSPNECINWIVANRERTIFAVVTATSLYFYHSNTRLLACQYKRNEEDLGEKGAYKLAFWKPDSSAICIATEKNCLNIFTVELPKNLNCFNLHDSTSDATFSRESSEFYLTQSRPPIHINLSVVAHLESEPTCILSFKEELIVCLRDGWMHRLGWSGNVIQELSLNVRSMTVDQHHGSLQKADRQHSISNLISHVIDISPFLGGLCAVFNDGRAALFVSSTANFQPGSVNTIWASGLSNSCCCATNSKYRLIYFGCQNGDIVAYSLDDLNGVLVQIFNVRLKLKNGTEYLEKLTSVRQIRCVSPQGSAFAVVWDSVGASANGAETLDKKAATAVAESSMEEDRCSFSHQQSCHPTPPALALFSPFGAQWWCSLEDNAGQMPQSDPPLLYTGLDWGVEGFQLWMGTNTNGVQLIQLVHSTTNSNSRLLMVGADRVYMCPSNAHDQASSSAPHLVWQQFKPPHNYIFVNGPIRHVATNATRDSVLAVAGSHGFCFYNFKNAKWRMFRKEAQEHALLLTGGIAVFDDFIICSACNLDENDDDNEHIYAFHVDEQLDLDLAQSVPTSRVVQMTQNRSHLLTFDVNSVISIYAVDILAEEKADKREKATIQTECLAEIRITEFLPHPSCLISMGLAKLNFHSDALAFCDELDSLLVNVSGHLLLLSPMQPQQPLNEKSANGELEGSEVVAEFQLHPPTLIASCVEQFWTIHQPMEAENWRTEDAGEDETATAVPLLDEALWINAGSKKSRIWLPLSLESNSGTLAKKGTAEGGERHERKLVQQNSRTFISRRIMLPIELDIYPLSIAQDYLACGANCISMQLRSLGGGRFGDEISLADDGSSLCSFVALARINEGLSPLAVHNLTRVNEVFVHKLLKQLLKRNLGAYAFELASSCRPLPYFAHILELLLHDILDEEATSSEPIPDPLLPTAVSFLREFPAEYLQTIVHCARKTELAFWNLLFSVSHHPRQLFQMCLQEEQLETATSCLIILHSMENIQESARLAFQLLEEALAKRKWTVVKDIVRFMQNISHAVEQETPAIGNSPESPLQHKLSSLGHHHLQSKHPFSGFSSSNDEFNFPLFSSHMDAVGDSSAALLQQRRRSGSGKGGDLSAAAAPKQVGSSASAQGGGGGLRQHSKSGVSAYSPPNKEKLANQKHSLPPLNIGRAPPPNQNEEHNGQIASYVRLDETLAKYASNLLEDYALRDLGAFSSYVAFDLVSFLRRSANAAFSVPATDFPLVLMKLHAQFNWPYPVVLPTHSLVPSSSSSRIAELENGVRKPHTENNNTLQNGLRADAKRPNSASESSAADLSTMLEGESLQSGSVNGAGKQPLVYNCNMLDRLCERSRVKGTAQAEAELAYICSLLQRAEAFEWLYLVLILRQDVQLLDAQLLEPMQRTDFKRRRTDQFLRRVREGTRELYEWAQAKCPAYSVQMRLFKQFVDRSCET